MAEEIKVLKGISKGGETYDIDAKYWNGKTDIDHIYVWDVSFICDSNGDELNPSITNSYSRAFEIKYITPVIENYLEGKPIYIYKVVSRDPYDDDIITDAILLPTYVVKNGNEFHIHVYTTSIDTNPNLEMVYGNYIIDYEDLYDDASATLGMYGYVHGFADVDNLKTINGSSLIGTGNINTTPTLKTINNQSIVGTGNINTTPTLKTINNQSIVGTGNINTTPTLKTINGQSLLGSGYITNYYVCGEDSSAEEKIINATNINISNIKNGDKIWINFTNGNSYNGRNKIKFNYSGGGSIDLYLNLNGYNGADNSSADGIYRAITFSPGVYEFMYIDNNTSDSNAGYLYFTGNMFNNSTSPYLRVISGGSGASGRIFYDMISNVHHIFSDDLFATFNGLRVLPFETFADYSFEFKSVNGLTFEYPSEWKWANGIVPHIKANKRYHVSVKNDCAVIAEFDV